MAGKRDGTRDDFTSDEVAQPAKPHLDPTRSGASSFGLEEIDQHGDVSFHAIVTALFNIGRDPDSNLVIRKDTKTSRKHATIRRKGDRFVIEDNGSSNGTLVNDEKIEGARLLEIGDRILIGTHAFTFARRP